MKKIHTFVVLAYKESEYLENCIKSVINQTVESNVVIMTSTPNKYIKDLAKKYNLEIIVNKGEKGMSNDFNFAYNCAKTELVTLAHQDDFYEKKYAETVLENYIKYKDSLILFTDYYEIRNNKKVESNRLLRIKRVLLFPLKKSLGKYKFNKRIILRFGNAICCPAVTFCKKNIPYQDIFSTKYNCSMDWAAWERMSKLKGRFVFIKKKYVGHRIHVESTTSEILGNDKRNQEDYEIYCKFWPKWFSKIISRVYKTSENSNRV